MDLQTIVVSLFAVVIGAAFTFFGLRLFLILLPIWGFFAGFVIGAELVTKLFGDAFLATVTSWVVGFIFALVFAVLAYLYYYAAVVILAGTVGYAILMGIFASIGFTGFIAFAIALAVGILFGIGALLLNLPTVLAVVLTAVGGAITTVGGVLILFGRVPLDSFSGSLFQPVLDEAGFIGELAVVVLAIAGIVVQYRDIRSFSISPTSYRNPGMSTV
jgi:hypothetical protein